MKTTRLILAELGHRKLNFALSLFAVAAAAACVLGVFLLLAVHDARTEALLEERRARIEKRGKALQDDMRKITKGLGFNILILPKDQNLAEVYTDGYAAKTMPEEYVARLAGVPSIKTIDHLLPSLEQKVTWPELKRAVILIGIRGEVPFVGRKQKKPLLQPVAEGEVVLGYELHNQMGVTKGDTVTFMGRELRVAETYSLRGTKDDITLWISLPLAQEILDKKGRINAIWALNCNCHSVEMLAEVRTEVQKHLPETQVLELAGKATARAEARKRAFEDAVAALDAEKRSRAQWRRQFQSFGGVLLPVVLLVCGVWVGILALSNVRERRTEIGLLRAVGVQAGRMTTLFLGRAAIVGLLGALLGSLFGCAAGWIGVQLLAGEQADSLASSALASLGMPVLVVLVCAPILSALASWLPAQHAGQLDPAAILRRD